MNTVDITQRIVADWMRGKRTESLAMAAQYPAAAARAGLWMRDSEHVRDPHDENNNGSDAYAFVNSLVELEEGTQ